MGGFRTLGGTPPPLSLWAQTTYFLWLTRFLGRKILIASALLGKILHPDDLAIKMKKPLALSWGCYFACISILASGEK
jgi:hypothetical protein